MCALLLAHAAGSCGWLMLLLPAPCGGSCNYDPDMYPQLSLDFRAYKPLGIQMLSPQHRL